MIGGARVGWPKRQTNLNLLGLPMRKFSVLVASLPLFLSVGRVAPFANTLNNLVPDIFAAVDVVSRELVGFIPAADRDSNDERAALGELIRWPKVPELPAGDTTPAMAIPEPTDMTVGSDTMSITKSRNVPFGFTGEERKGLNNGVGALTIQGYAIAQALRTLTNEMETDLALAARLAASRATGTAGTTPFATNLGDSAQVRKILDDNGAPASPRSLIVNTATGASLRTLGQLTKANEVGDAMTVRDGELINLHNFSIKESGALGSMVTKGTNNGSASTNNAGYAIGATVITLASAGTGNILAGDVITFAGDTNKYLVVSGDADVSGGGTITIAAPGLRQAIAASNTVITTGASYAPNVAFSRNALRLITRAPALPEEGDAAFDRMTVVDPRSGIAFEFAIYLGYKKVRYEVAMAWGVKATKAEHIALLLG